MSKFIALEGIDGSGKTTIANKLAAYLFDKSKDNNVFLTREPTKDFKEIRSKLFLSDNIYKDANWYLDAFIQDRINHLNNYIKPFLEKGVYVISDRYDLSTYAYQCAQGIDIEIIKQKHTGIISADIYILLDCDVEISYKRRNLADKVDVFDKDIDFQKKVKENYLKLINLLPEKNIYVFDANIDIDLLFKNIINTIDFN